MTEFPIKVGDGVTFAKTITETDVYLFAGITGDFSPVHVNQQYMEGSRYGRRLAHGALVVGLMSTTSWMANEKYPASGKETPMSVGYDRIRFIKPVFYGDTLTVRYEYSQIDEERRRTISDIKVTNQDDELVAVANHILQWVPTG